MNRDVLPTPNYSLHFASSGLVDDSELVGISLSR